MVSCIFRNLPFSGGMSHAKYMPYLPQAQPHQRPPRVKLSEITPVALRFSDGSRTSGNLQVVSVTGGLLSMTRPVAQGSVVKLMFLTRKGPVLGAAEMLTPLSWDQQPFRFVSLYDDDQSRLHAAIHSSLEQNRHDQKHSQQGQDQVERLRAW
jgi:hypothetical protein